MLSALSRYALSDPRSAADVRRLRYTAGLVLVAHGLMMGLIIWAEPTAVAPPRPLPIQVSLLSAGPVPLPPMPSNVRSVTAPPPVSRPPPPAPIPSPRRDSPPEPAVESAVQSPSVAAAAEARPAEATAPAVASSSAPSVAVSRGPQTAPSVASPEQGDRQPSVDASFRGNRVPDYPPMSRRLGEQGVVILRVLISAEGRAVDVRLLRSSGSERLDRSAMEAIREWRFIPASRGGKPEAAWYEWRWEFRLSG